MKPIFAALYMLHLDHSQEGAKRQQTEEGDLITHLQKEGSTKEAHAKMLPAE